ncbi:MAG: thiamine biosynthesis protein ThiF, partial [Hymenobacter sp.]
MARKLFSHSLRRDNRPVTNPQLAESLRCLAQCLGVKALKPLAWDDDHIAIALMVDVELPPLGNYDGLDIRAQEPVLLVLSRAHYPTKTPAMYPDRLNFPKNQFAHLYVAAPGRPPGFCLVRGDFKEWYANRRLSDVVVRTRNWLRDAATGELAVDGEQFDPVRLEGYRGSIVYPYDVLANVVQTDAAYASGHFAVALFENTASGDASPIFRLDQILTANTAEAAIKLLFQGMKDLLAADSPHIKKYDLGYVLWSADPTTYATYNVDLPRSWSGLQAFCHAYGLDLASLEQFLVRADLNYLPQVPVVCAVRRPQQLIGFSANLEFINFYLTLNDADKDRETELLIQDIPVQMQRHSEPLTRRKAREISAAPAQPDAYTWVAGCGALGSKVVMHFARSGYTNLVLLDPDRLSPHNLVRHALLAEHEGMNKALALKQVVQQLYRHEGDVDVLAASQSADFILAPQPTDKPLPVSRLLDFTASEAFLHTVIDSTILNQAVVSRGLISDHGQLGILSLEG